MSKHSIYIFFLFSLVMFSLMSCASSEKDNSSNGSDIQINQNNTDLVINGFEKKEEYFFGKIDNDIEIFSFLNAVTVNENSSWKLFTDVTGSNEITTKTVNLKDGDNVYYILVIASENEMKLYTINVYRLHMYNVSFITGGGTSISSQKIQEDSLINPVENPEKKGYDFAGWNYDFSEPVKSDLTICAEWVAHKCNISFDINGGDIQISDLEVFYGDYVSLPTPTRTGYTFLGWYFNGRKMSSGKWYYDEPILLTAEWSLNNYKITYNPNGGELMNSTIQYVNYGENFTLQNIIRTGYNFCGWYFKDELFESGTWNYLSDVSLTAKWVAETYQVKLNLNGGVIEKDSEFNIEYDSYLVLPIPTKTGYTFSGWFDSDNQVFDQTWNYLTNKTFSAKWTAINYSVSMHDVSIKLYNVRYDYNDGRGTFKEVKLGIGDSVEYLIPESQDKNTFFVGWYRDPECKNLYQFNDEITESFQLFAKWKVIDMVNFIALKGNTVLNRQAYINPSEPIVFVAPYTGQLSLKVSGVKTDFYICYDIYKYVDDKGLRCGNIKVNSEGAPSTSYGETNLNVKEGDIYYLRLYSATDIVTTMKMNINFELINKLDLKSKVVSKLNFNSIDVTYDSQFNLTKLNYCGYEFKGWYSEVNGNGLKIDTESTWKYTNVLDIYPYLVPQQYSISLEPNGEIIDQFTTEVIYNSDFILPIPTKTGHSFDGWYYENNLISNGIWRYTSDINLEAKWTANSYKCTFSEYTSGINIYIYLNMNDGYHEIYDQIELCKDEVLNFPTPPQRKNYCFTGWYIDSTCSKEFDLSNEIKNDTIIYAGWKTYQNGTGNPKDALILNGAKKKYYFTDSMYFLTFVALDSGTYILNYENVSSDVGCFLNDYNDSSIDEYIKFSEEGSFKINVIKGHMYCVGLTGDLASSNCATIWLTGNFPSTTVKLSDNLNLVMEYTYGINYDLGIPNVPDGKTFIGWYTGENGTGEKLTDKEGKSLDIWKYDNEITVYPYFE